MRVIPCAMSINRIIPDKIVPIRIDASTISLSCLVLPLWLLDMQELSNEMNTLSVSSLFEKEIVHIKGY
jgi:hypothetical protein